MSEIDVERLAQSLYLTQIVQFGDRRDLYADVARRLIASYEAVGAAGGSVGIGGHFVSRWPDSAEHAQRLLDGINAITAEEDDS